MFSNISVFVCAHKAVVVGRLSNHWLRRITVAIKGGARNTSQSLALERTVIRHWRRGKEKALVVTSYNTALFDPEKGP